MQDRLSLQADCPARRFVSRGARLLWLLPGLLLLLWTPAWAVEGDQLLQRFLQHLDTYSAGFEQVLYSESGEILEQSVGVVYIERPGKFHWAYFDPYSQYIISDGRTLWIYDEDLQQVTIKDVTGALDDSPAAILGGDGDLNRYYVVLDLGTAEDMEWIELTPRDEESQYRSIRLGFRDGQIGAMILFDNLGQKTRITFHDAHRNPPLDEGLFTLSPPDGVDVIDGRGAAAAN